MAVKCTGAEYKAFMASDWGEMFMDDFVISINGVDVDFQYGGLDEAEDAMQPSDKVVIKEGGVYEPVQIHDSVCGHDTYVRSLESHFKLWRKAQTTSFLSVECQNDKLEAVKTAIVAAGGKIK